VLACKVRLALNLIAATFAGLIAVACWIQFASPRAVDFVSFWAAARMLLIGRTGAIYDISAHRAVEALAAPIQGLLPFPYPPPFLFFIAPLGSIPFAPAFATWVFGTGLIYFLASRSSSLAHPCVVPNGFVGQTGFLTAAIFLGGCRFLRDRPLLGGAILGLMVIKPQLGLLIPIALVAGRQWRAIGAAALSSIALLAAALLIFGLETYRNFLDVLPQYAEWMSSGRWLWREVASPFAFARFFDVDAPIALGVHALVAVAATLAVWSAWRNDRPGKIPILAAASVLISPYLFSYDCLLLAAPFVSLARRGSYLTVVVWLLAALPVAGNFGLYTGPNTLPIAAIVSLASLLVCTHPKSINAEKAAFKTQS